MIAALSNVQPPHRVRVVYRLVSSRQWKALAKDSTIDSQMHYDGLALRNLLTILKLLSLLPYAAVHMLHFSRMFGRRWFQYHRAIVNWLFETMANQTTPCVMHTEAAISAAPGDLAHPAVHQSINQNKPNVIGPDAGATLRTIAKRFYKMITIQ